MPKTKKDYYDSDSEEEVPKQKKAKKKKKDPNAPKRPTTAYFFYAGEVRPAIREEQPGECTLSDKISADKTAENPTCCRKCCPPKIFVH